MRAVSPHPRPASRLRRWVLGAVALAGTAVVLGGGCGAPFDPPAKVNGLRVLSVVADHPYANGGDTVKFHLEYLDGFVDPEHPDDRRPPPSILWLGGCVDPIADEYFGCYASLAQIFSKIDVGALAGGDLSKLDELRGLVKINNLPSEPGETAADFSTTLPADIVSRRPVPPTGPHYGLAYVFFAICAGEFGVVPPEGSGRAGSFPFGCFEPGTHKRLGAESFVAGFTQVYAFADGRTNGNPEIHDLLLDGTPIVADTGATGAGGSGAAGIGGAGGAAGSGGSSGGTGGSGGAGETVLGTSVELCSLTEDDRRVLGCTAKDPYAECKTYKIKAVIPSDVADKDPDGRSASGEELTEAVWLDFFASGGDFEDGILLVNDPTTGFVGDNLETRWIPPSEPGLVHFYAVLRDNRGGQSYITRDVLVRCGSNADCSSKGLVCDTVTGGCVTCLSDSDCPAGLACVDHGCLPP